MSRRPTRWRGPRPGGRSPQNLGLLLVAVIVVAAGFALRASANRQESAPIPGAALPTPRELAVLMPSFPRLPWLAQDGNGRWSYGEAGSPSRSALPAGESGLAIDQTHIASVTTTADRRSHLILRERSSGRAIGAVDLPIWASAAAFSGQTLVVTGYGDGTAASDGGLLVVDVPSLAVEVVHPQSAFPKAFGSVVGRGAVYISPDRRFAASNICGETLCNTQVVDLVSREVFQPMKESEGFLRALTNEAIVTTDGAYEWIAGLDLVTGNKLWRVTDSLLMEPMATEAGGVTGLLGSQSRGFAIATIGPDGVVRDLTTRVTGQTGLPHLWPEVSAADIVVVGSVGFENALQTEGGGVGDLLRIADAKVLASDVLVLPSR